MKGYEGVRRAQRRLANSLPQGFVSHHKFDIDYNTGESIHQSAAGQVKLGLRFAASLAKNRGKQATDRRGPIVTAMSRNPGTGVVTLTVDLNGATALTADAGTLKGFQMVAAPGYDGSQAPSAYFTNPANVIPVTPAVSGNTITLTPASNPGGPVALRYAVGTAISGDQGLVFSGGQPFDQPYSDTGGQAAPPQIRGTMPDGEAIGLYAVGGLAA